MTTEREQPGAWSKVPVPTAGFWITKVLITGACVWWPDYLYSRFGPVAVSAVIGAVLVALLGVQLRAPRYHPWIYWPAFTTISVAGTEAANGPYRLLGLAYSFVLACYLVVLVIVVMIWRAGQNALSVRGIRPGRPEICYWAAVLAGFAAGSALGHALDLGFGRLGDLGFIVVVTAVTALAWWRFRLSAVVAFWMAFVLTRPLGAGLASWLADPRDGGGLGLGQWPVSAGLAVLVTGLVVSAAALALSPAARRACASR
jgi:uncharacterized membrane-anchored protein